MELPRAGGLAPDAPTPRSPAGPDAPRPPVGTLSLVGHAHIDPVWLWQWQEGFAEIKATWRSALDRLREYPEARFTASSAAFYEWIEQHEPRMFREIQERVAEGRWELAGGWWVEPDCDIPSGESFVRHALYGQRWFLDRFGRTAAIAFNPDAFGHDAGLARILAGSGYRGYVFMRPQVHEMQLPRIFRWTGPDGSAILTFRILWEYGTWVPELDGWIRRSAAELSPDQDELLVFYGVGNHGGGPTRANLDSLRRLAGTPGLPRLEHRTMGEYFELLHASGREYPVVAGELQRHAPGCYSAHSGVKRWNRRSEAMLGPAERWATAAAAWIGLPSSQADLERAWRGVLFGQFHDILAGTAIEPAYDDVRDLHGEAMSIASRALNHATQALARRIDLSLGTPRGPSLGTPGDSSHGPPGRPIVVFNPHAWPARLDVELEYGALPAAPGLRDDAGRPVALQAVRSQATVYAGRSRLSFLADLPPLGYRVFRLAGDQPPAEPSLVVDERAIDNGIVRLEVAGDGVVSVRDHRSGRDLLAHPGISAVVIADGNDTWGHGLDRLDQEVGRFGVTTTRVVERGPVRGRLRVESAYRSSTLIQDFIVRDGSPLIEVRATLDWGERWRAVKLRFPVAVSSPTVTFETAYGELAREPTGLEVHGHRWVDVTGLPEAGPVGGTGGGGPQARAGLALLNDSKHGFDSLGSDLGMTVVRSPVYAHHEPYLPLPTEDHEFQDQGVQRFRYALLPHDGDRVAAGVSRFAAELEEPPIALVETDHDGDLPTSGSFLSLEPDTLDLTVLKRWEDGEDLVVRMLERSGRPTTARLHLPILGRDDTFEVGAHELLTLRVPIDAVRPVERLDLLERPLASATGTR